MKPCRIGHVVLNVLDLDRAERFYCETLGFEFVNRLERPRAVFLTLGEQHHDLALFELPKPLEELRPVRPGLHHIALKLEDYAALAQAHAELTRAGVCIVRAVDHGTTNSVYFEDPDGNRLELYCDVGVDTLARARRRTVRDIAEFPALDLQSESVGREITKRARSPRS